MDIETTLKVLSITTDLLTTPCSLDEALANITSMTGALMDTGQTAVLLRDEERSSFVVRSCHGVENGSLQSGHTLDVPPRLTRLLWRVRCVRQIGWVETGIQGLGFPLLVVPLRVKGKIIGLLITGKPKGGAVKFSSNARRLFTLIASLASLILENAKIYDYLRQQFAQHSRDLMEENRKDANGGDETHQLMVSSLGNPNKVVRLLASSFYKELNRAGFTEGHITMAAAEILDCITREEKG